MAQETQTIGFRSVELMKTQTLGIGSYGSVCKAICDDLLCAAKVLHPTLFDPTAHQQIARHREHRLPIRRFEQECEFMSAIKHPNIVQYLGTCQDPETQLPVLLMELMDDSLTHFLESSRDPVPYHIQVNFCHDITLAITYLHSNSITHRDLSSNNVLLCGNVKAKVTDFGMAKLRYINSQATRLTFTTCPGTDAYMPPEAVSNQATYTAKIDCFAIGTLVIQILTRKFPKPGDRHKTVNTTDPRFPTLEVRVSEIERRQNHISEVDPNHPLLPIALDCLKDSDVERPSAQELCHRVSALKETPRYTESVRNDRDGRLAHYDTESEEQITAKNREEYVIIEQKEAENHELREYVQQIPGLQRVIARQNEHLQETIRNKDQQIEEKDRELRHIRECLETRIQELEQQMKRQTQTNEQLPTLPRKEHVPDTSNRAKPPPPISRKASDISARVEPPQLPKKEHVSDTSSKAEPPPLPRKHRHSDTSSGAAATTDSIKLSCREANKAPCMLYRGSNAVVSGNIVYVTAGARNIYSYNATDDTWDTLSEKCPERCSLAVVNTLLTTIGGVRGSKMTNQLFSLTGEGSNKRWREVFKPMPTERDQTVAVHSGQALIVAGGMDQYGKILRNVEVMDIATQQWSTAADLPGLLYDGSATICGDRIYTLGGWSDRGPTKSVYTCLLINLFQSCHSSSLGARLAQSLTLTGHARSTAVWEKVADSATGSTCVTLHGRLMAIGGNDEYTTPTSDIRVYQQTTNSWEVISKMTISRNWCFAAVLPNNQLMVVGGKTTQDCCSTDSVEIASVV